MSHRTVCAEVYSFMELTGGGYVSYTKRDGRWHRNDPDEGIGNLECMGLGLRELGVARGVPVAIMARTRQEWIHLDIAILSVGGITVGIHDTLPPEEVGYIVEHSESRVVVIENQELLDRHRETLLACPQVRNLVVIDPVETAAGGTLMTLDELKALGEGVRRKQPGLFKELLFGVRPDDVATYMYTSGTTGRPKAAILTHRNVYESASSMRGVLPFEPYDVGLVFLPLSHIMQRVIVYMGVDGACGTPYFAESIPRLIDNIAEVRPTVMGCVPRIFEKIHARVLERVEKQPAHRRGLFHWALEVGRQVSQRRQRKEPVPAWLAARHQVADRLVLSRVRRVLGGRPKFLASGAAPLSRDIAEFFHACGVLILEGYGLSETSSAMCINRMDDYKFGTAGKPVPNARIRIAEDGEILVDSPGVFQGYLKDEAETRAVLRDGWFHTGDIGHIDEDGFLVITDRKKDIIVTAGGKNIAPQKIEKLLLRCPLISHVLVHGDRRKFLTALVTLDAEELIPFAERQGIPGSDPEKLAGHPAVLLEIERSVSDANRRLPSFETIKKFRILPRDFSMESGELTPSLKVKRKEVTRRYRDVLDALYA